jgi:putative ABC transport system permease protein
MNAESVRLWLRWSWRDLRHRWPLVTALALIIAVGTGAYAGLGGTTAWRISSNDASYAALRMHDLRVRLPDGGFVSAGRLAGVAQGIEASSSIAAVEERLVVPTQVDASTASRSVMVPGEIVGMPSSGAAAPVDRLHVAAGRGLRAADATAATAVLESKFADEYRLPEQGEVIVSGGRQVRYVGTGYTPEYFRVLGRTGQLLGEVAFAVLFMPLPSAQTVTGHPGAVNDLVLRLAPGAARDQVQAQLAAAVASLGATVTTRDDDPVYRGLYADARNDQKIWNMFAVLILLGAAFAAFNLVTRMIEAQRRELGIGMALGVSPRVLALRPLLVGIQIAVLGVAAGIGVGWLMGVAMRREMAVLLPLPIWLTPFQTGRFVQAAVLGLLISFGATLLPIRRALRLQPVDAIRTGAYGAAGRAGRLATLVRGLRLPGRTYTSMPVRNVARAPRRTGLTALGVAAAVTCLVAVVGLLDSFVAVGDRSAAELERANPGRLAVTLTTFYPQDSPQVRAITNLPGVAAVEPQLRLSTRLRANRRELDTVTEVLDLHNTVWTPTITAGATPIAASGIVLSEKAAADLGVEPGDTVDFEHPVRTDVGFQLTTTPMQVSGLHPNPIRTFTYVDASQAALFGLVGGTNLLTVVPRMGASQDQLLRALFDRPDVAAVESTSAFTTLVKHRLRQFTGILRVIEIATLLLALLIAFNTASLSADERAREHATMFAFGLSPSTVTGMAIAENALIGLAGTLVGLGLGHLALNWIVSGFDTVMPDLQVGPVLSRGSVLATVALGVLVVALAPVLNSRRQRRMDVPAALRVVE